MKKALNTRIYLLQLKAQSCSNRKIDRGKIIFPGSYQTIVKWKQNLSKAED